MSYEDTKRARAHALHLDQREKLSITGVEEVDSFDESAVCLHTTAGYLIIRGSELHIEKLNLDGGELALAGLIDSLSYEEMRKSGGLLARLFRPS